MPQALKELFQHCFSDSLLLKLFFFPHKKIHQTPNQFPTNLAEITSIYHNILLNFLIVSSNTLKNQLKKFFFYSFIKVFNQLWELCLWKINFWWKKEVWCLVGVFRDCVWFGRTASLFLLVFYCKIGWISHWEDGIFGHLVPNDRGSTSLKISPFSSHNRQPKFF